MELRVCVIIFLCVSLLLGIFDLSQGCDDCPIGEATVYLPPAPSQKTVFFLTRRNPPTTIGAPCNKKKPRTNIKINPGQFLEIKRVTNEGLFRVLKLTIKVCKVTNVRVRYWICVIGPLFPALIWHTRDVPVSGCGCKTIKFVFPVPPPGDPVKLPPNVCGQSGVRLIRFYFTKNPACNGKVKVKCVEMKSCLQGFCIEG